MRYVAILSQYDNILDHDRLSAIAHKVCSSDALMFMGYEST